MPPYELATPGKQGLDRVVSAFKFAYTLIMHMTKCSCKCSVMFRIAEADPAARDKNRDVREGGKDHSGKVGQGSSGTGHTETNNTGILLPAVYVITFSTEAID